MKGTRMYEPYGYREQYKYSSQRGVIEEFVDEFFTDVRYNKLDKKIHFSNVYGNEKVSIDVREFDTPGIVNTTYDKTTRILTLELDNGNTEEINLTEIIGQIEASLAVLVEEEKNRAISVELVLKEMVEAIADGLAEISGNAIGKLTYEWDSENKEMVLKTYNVNEELKDTVGLFDTDEEGEILLEAGDF